MEVFVCLVLGYIVDDSIRGQQGETVEQFDRHLSFESPKAFNGSLRSLYGHQNKKDIR